ncbi:MAG: YigZ family protein [Ardenticatenales bacterium]|nr:YigZ family protein [Ardenticatenales bacterium]
MDENSRYPIPAGKWRIEAPVSDSRFIATGGHTPTVEAAERFLARIRTEFADATHNCFAWRIGYQRGVVERMSDDGEPSGTAGRPMLAVLQGQDVGDVAVVVTRYFGGTKLGTGGLVRAYAGAVRTLMAAMPSTWHVERISRQLVVDYPRYEQIVSRIADYEGEIHDEAFAADVTLVYTMPRDRIANFDAMLTDFSYGQLVSTSPTNAL